MPIIDALEGPILRPIIEALLAELDDGAIHDRPTARRAVIAKTGANPSTLGSLIAEMGTHGIIDRPKGTLRLTTLGRVWAQDEGLIGARR